MAQKTLENILTEISAYVDQDAALPTGSDLTTRINIVDQALQEWGNGYEWSQLRVESSISFAFSGTSTALDTRFKKMMSPVFDYSNGVPVANDFKYSEIDPRNKRTKTTTDKYITIGGNHTDGWHLNINPPMASGFSGAYYWQGFPSSMATLQDVCVCPHPEFVTKRSIALVLESRSDPRFPHVKSDAQTLLDRMTEEEAKPSGAENNRVPDWQRNTGFVLGE